jgi:TonB family protein
MRQSRLRLSGIVISAAGVWGITLAGNAPQVPASCGDPVYEYFAPGPLVVWGLADREKKVSLKLEHVPLAQVLDALSASTGLVVENHTTMSDVGAIYRREKLENVLLDLADRYPIVYEVPSPDRLRVYDTVKPPKVLSKVVPEYPADARKAHVSGKVFLGAIICRDGSLGWLEVQKSPTPSLGEAAASAVRRWKYSPATKDGSPIAVYQTEVIEFND